MIGQIRVGIEQLRCPPHALCKAILEDAKGALAVTEERVQAGDPVRRLIHAVWKPDGRFLRDPQGGLIVGLLMRS